MMASKRALEDLKTQIDTFKKENEALLEILKMLKSRTATDITSIVKMVLEG